jgi:cytochrome P450
MVDMMGWDFNLGLMVYGERWRIHRKAFHEVFRPEAAVSFRPIQLNSIHALLLKLMENPENFVTHLRT